ncbi:Rieske (2Fe-2S) protein [Rhodococcus sp. UNC23MFCrub1.1]|uniref:Rieske (2Fe-2S) protein n=1 Tax=Rhodococcus sp. UNC23MFCrub1.1 TaxID=1449068 RepID=UPI00068ECB3D|nr:Rieske 2Fe-2S domain-containing protein [Rhodococcus sp. UNC23MFCrub1.1]
MADDHAPAPRPRSVLPPVLHDQPIRARGRDLVRVADLDERGVAEVRTDDHGVLAVGIRPDGTPFAVANTCRHQLAKLGRGRVTENGCLQCPWHRAEFDVTDGSMVSGPKGVIFGFPPYSAVVAAVGRAVPLTTAQVEIVDGVIRLAH